MKKNDTADIIVFVAALILSLFFTMSILKIGLDHGSRRQICYDNGFAAYKYIDGRLYCYGDLVLIKGDH